MNEVLKAIREVNISIACLLDDIAVDENNETNANPVIVTGFILIPFW